MKKFLMIFSLPFLLTSIGALSSCSTKEKINILFGDKNAVDVQTISFIDLEEKINSENNFMIVVQYSDGCACWRSEAHPILQRFATETKAIVYHIKYDDLRAGGSTFGIKIIEGSVSFAIFEKGKINVCLNTRDNPQLKDYSLFKQYMLDTIYLPKIYYINQTDLENIYKSEEKSIVYFTRTKCGDCGYLNENFLPNWNKSHQNYIRPIYAIDCYQPGIYLDQYNNVDSEQWNIFKGKYGLTSSTNPTYGYETGFVPTFFLVEGSNISTTYLNGIVVYNDSVTKLEENKYQVNRSYFTEDRLQNLKYIDDSIKNKIIQGLNLNNEDVDVYPSGYISWKHESAQKYHDPLMEKFLDYVEKQ